MVWRTRPCTGSWLSRPPAPKHTHALHWLVPQGRTEYFPGNGIVKVDPDCAQDTLFSYTFTPQLLLPTPKWQKLSLSNRWANSTLCLTSYAAPVLWQHPHTHTEQWSGPSPFLHGGPGGALEARRGNAGGQQAQTFELLAGFFSGEKVAGNGQSWVHLL